MKFLNYVLFACIALICLPFAAAQDADGQALLEKMDAVMFAAPSQHGTLTLILTDRQGNERTREATVWQQGEDKRLFRFTAPAAEAGIAFLSLPGDVMYLYMPAFGRERRIASHVRNQSFAGTDFSYEDLESGEYGERFHATLIEAGEACYRLELTPRDGRSSDYSRIMVKIHREHFFPMAMELYDRGGNQVKTATYSFAKEGPYWYPEEISMTDLRRNHNTRMIMTSVDFDADIDPQVFTVRHLSRY